MQVQHWYWHQLWVPVLHLRYARLDYRSHPHLPRVLCHRIAVRLLHRRYIVFAARRGTTPCLPSAT
jgi:hypothetical protein